jgi:hypothetical protein
MFPPQIAACNRPRLQAMEIVARSGRDDLRRNSVLEVHFVTNDERRRGNPIKIFDNGLGQNLRGTAELRESVHYGSDAGQILVNGGLKRIKFKFKSGSTNAFDTADNWDMVELIVRARLREVDGTVREVNLVDPMRGNPIHRFRDNDEWEVDVKPGALGR